MWQVHGGAYLAPVSICFVHETIKRARAKGLNCTSLLERSGIDPQLLQQDDARVSVENYAILQMLTMQEMRDESLGYSPRPHKLGVWATACRAAVHPGPMGDALDRLCKFYSLFDWGLRVRLVIQGEEAVVEVSPPHDAELEYELGAYETALATIHRFASWLIDATLPLKAVTFRHSRPDYAPEYAWLFQHSPVFFDQPRAGFHFDRRLLDKPVQQDERTLESVIRNGYLDLLDQDRKSASWAAQLRERIRHSLPELPEFETLAQQLKMHPQTLRRRLAAEGVTYNEIKDEVRREAGEYYLRVQALSVAESAFRSGFSEASAFIRAFKRWHGMTPHAYAETRHTVRRVPIATRTQ
jgi:AraC-like DNA-binding protein